MGRGSNPGLSRDLSLLTASRPSLGPAKFSFEGEFGGKVAEV